MSFTACFPKAYVQRFTDNGLPTGAMQATPVSQRSSAELQRQPRSTQSSEDIEDEHRTGPDALSDIAGHPAVPPSKSRIAMSENSVSQPPNYECTHMRCFSSRHRTADFTPTAGSVRRSEHNSRQPLDSSSQRRDNLLTSNRTSFST